VRVYADVIADLRHAQSPAHGQPHVDQLLVAPVLDDLLHGAGSEITIADDVESFWLSDTGSAAQLQGQDDATSDADGMSMVMFCTVLQSCMVSCIVSRQRLLSDLPLASIKSAGGACLCTAAGGSLRQ
jgi:hypothetical protein